MKVTTTYELLKIELGVLNEEKLNLLKRFDFLRLIINLCLRETIL